MGFSLIALIDGAEDCSSESALSYYGLIIWTLLIVYLFVGLYVLCEQYFVPILITISRRLNMSEDVAGATLMAAGSSAPELFTALIGVLFYADENPGPSTNCASAAFNMCIIVGASIYFSGYRSLPIRGYPFIRDCTFYALAVIELYLFWEVITPGNIGWFESFFLVFSWSMYIVVLIYNNRVIRLCVRLMGLMGLTTAEEMLYDQLKTSIKRTKLNDLQCMDMSDYSDYDDDDSDINEYLQIQQTQTDKTKDCINKQKQDEMVSLSKLHTSQQQLLTKDDDIDIVDHSRHFISMNIEEPDTDQLNKELKHKSKINPIRISKKPPSGPDNSITDISKLDVGGGGITSSSSTDIPIPTQDNSHSHSKCVKFFHASVIPFDFCFKWTIPSTNNSSSTPLLISAFCLCIVWLAILTFICVDAAEKMGNCLSIDDDVMGLTILAIGSSLPDCFSSILAAKQGKGEMAVSNALGSNVFDINICIGVSFLLKSIINGFEGITVEQTTGFELFIAALFLLLAIFMVSMFCFGLVLNRKIGAILFICYLIFLGTFCYLLQFD